MSDWYDARAAWTEARVERLKELWLAGLSSAEIGRQLDVTKNMVIGKARRLGLPGRGSPIKRGVERVAAPRPVPRAGKITLIGVLEVLNGPVHFVASEPKDRSYKPTRGAAIARGVGFKAAVEDGDFAARMEVAELNERRARASLEARAAYAEPARTYETVFKPRKPTACVWPSGDGPRVTFECDRTAVENRPYCPAHCARAYLGFAA